MHWLKKLIQTFSFLLGLYAMKPAIFQNWSNCLSRSQRAGKIDTVERQTRALVKQINSNNFFSIICDEASDFSKLEQLSFSVRSASCNNSYETVENFIGILPCDQGLTSDALLKYIQDILTRCNMDMKKLVGTAFDGASSIVRLAGLLKETFGDNLIHIHCFAHCNELVFKDATALSPMIAEAQDLCEDLYVLVGVSPKRVLLFRNIQADISDVSDTLRLKNLSQTRWTTRGSAAAVLIKSCKRR